MSAVIVADNGGGASNPHFILTPYDSQWGARSVVHDLIGGGLAVSLVAPRPRSGNLDLLFLAEADAFACAELHRQETTFTLNDTSAPFVSMTYVVTDAVRVHLDTDAHAWIVTIGYQGVE